jgi:hypothetical protein
MGGRRPGRALAVRLLSAEASCRQAIGAVAPCDSTRVVGQDSLQMGVVQDNGVVEALATDRADQPLDVRTRREIAPRHRPFGNLCT